MRMDGEGVVCRQKVISGSIGRSGYGTPMAYAFTRYFESKVLPKRPYLTKAMCVRVVATPVRREVQEDGERVRFWASVPELGGRFVRVVTLADERTIHNAFPDRRFKL